jgi:hypothetical protein
MLRTIDDVPTDDPPLIGCDRGELWARRNGITAGIDRRIRGRPQVRIERNPATVRRDPTGEKVEAVDIGGPTGGIDDPIGLDHLFATALAVDNAEPVAGPLDALDTRTAECVRRRRLTRIAGIYSQLPAAPSLAGVTAMLALVPFNSP